jgi:hypothetical protein
MGGAAPATGTGFSASAEGAGDPTGAAGRTGGAAAVPALPDGAEAAGAALAAGADFAACTFAAAAFPSWTRSRSATFGSTTLSWFFASRPRRPKRAIMSFEDMLSSLASSKILTLPVAIQILIEGALCRHPLMSLNSFAFSAATSRPAPLRHRPASPLYQSLPT